MQMNLSTNYAIRIIVELSKRGKQSSKDLANLLSIPEGYIMKITNELRKTNIIISKQGTSGGFLLNKEINDITLYDVIVAMESTMKINRCLEKDEFCSRCATKKCNIRKLHMHIQDQIEYELKKYTIYELLNQ